MKTPRCTKCKYFRKSKAKTRVYDHGKGISMKAPSLLEGMCTHYCINRWWNIQSLSFFRNDDVCDDFEFKKKQDYD